MSLAKLDDDADTDTKAAAVLSLRARLLCLCLCDAEGRRILNDGDAEAVSNSMAAEDVESIWNEAAGFNGLLAKNGEEPHEEAEKN